MGSRPTQPSQCTLPPLCSEKAAAGAEDVGSQRESVCGTDREGAEWGGMAPTEGASVVLKERQKVIITIARQVGGVQVREELVRICEFWKELEKSTEAQMRFWLRGWVRNAGTPPRLFACPLSASRGPGPNGKLPVLAVPKHLSLGHRASLGHTNTDSKPNS